MIKYMWLYERIYIWNKILHLNKIYGTEVKYMELLFLYINRTNNGFIEKQGFNFSPNYKFELITEENTYVLRQNNCDKKIPKNFFDNTGCISNVTAIVGENGSGKSTLLNELSTLFFSVKDEDHASAYNDYFNERYANEMRAAVFIENDELVCYHNIEKLENRAEIKDVYLYQKSPIFQEMIVNNKGCINISKIYITNSMYSIKNSISTDMNIDEIHLNINTLDTLKNIFYKGKIKKNSHLVGGYFSYLDLCRSCKTANEFQQILDVIYIGTMYEKKKKGILADNLHPDLFVSFQFYTKIIQDCLIKARNEKDNDDILVKAHNKLKSIIGESFIPILKINSICIAYCNLLYEIITYNRGNELDNIGVIRSKDDLKLSIESIIRNNSKMQSLFKEALDEIKEFDNCLCECPQTECLLPVGDMAYNSQIKVKYGSKYYKKFLKLVEKYAIHKKHSFMLKYIDIEGLQFSSGERALLNFFSWLNLVPFFKYISGDVQESLKDNVLILIDEIDLYCHPGWQQKMLYYLLDEARVLFHDKNVQIIFTTHSPIILSDIPKSNVIYLTKDEEKNKCRIDEPKNHDETFGANIYKLFDDAFFLEKQGQIGEFSKRKIMSLIDYLKPIQGENGEFIYKSIDRNILELEQEISLIGEPIIKDRLYTMLYKHKMEVGCKEEDKVENLIKVYEEKIKRLRNGENR